MAAQLVNCHAEICVGSLGNSCYRKSLCGYPKKVPLRSMRMLSAPGCNWAASNWQYGWNMWRNFILSQAYCIPPCNIFRILEIYCMPHISGVRVRMEIYMRVDHWSDKPFVTILLVPILVKFHSLRLTLPNSSSSGWLTDWYLIFSTFISITQRKYFRIFRMLWVGCYLRY